MASVISYCVLSSVALALVRGAAGTIRRPAAVVMVHRIGPAGTGIRQAGIASVTVAPHLSRWLRSCHGGCAFVMAGTVFV
jgi:hypothetical protein